MDRTLTRIAEAGIVPVVVIDDPADAPLLVRALIDGGLPIAEITFRTPVAAESIRRAVEAHPDALIGAGSVVLPEQLEGAIAAGASFIVSPGLVEDIVDQARMRGVVPIPGCLTPSDLMRAVRRGLEVVKYFPAEPSGGLDMIRAIAAPFPGLRFIPTGGIDTTSLERYLADQRILAIGGSWMVKAELIRARDWDAIRALTRTAVAAARRARGH
jgi:2-dehydro-3-deoxyphosphogluconate aldolase / (4S)-4-hydroxy-2-oxoglutarate aldolase